MSPSSYGSRFARYQRLTLTVWVAEAEYIGRVEAAGQKCDGVGGSRREETAWKGVEKERRLQLRMELETIGNLGSEKSVV